MIGAIVKELIGLFVDDELLAATILCAVALISAFAFSGVAPGWLVGLLLALALAGGARGERVAQRAAGDAKGMTPRGSRAREKRQEERMARRFIDISAPLQNDVPADPPGLGPKIEYIDHQQSLPQILPFFPGLEKEDCRTGRDGRSNVCSSQLTTAPISTRPGITIRR